MLRLKTRKDRKRVLIQTTEWEEFKSPNVSLAQPPATSSFAEMLLHFSSCLQRTRQEGGQEGRPLCLSLPGELGSYSGPAMSFTGPSANTSVDSLVQRSHKCQHSDSAGHHACP